MNVKFHKIASLNLLMDFVLILFAIKKDRSVPGLVLSIHLKAMVTQQNSAVWSVPGARAQPKHSGRDSHGQRDISPSKSESWPTLPLLITQLWSFSSH